VFYYYHLTFSSITNSYLGRLPNPNPNLFSYALPQGDNPQGAGRSSRVLEGNQLNIGVTGPGAAIALGLMYIRSENVEVSQRLALPQTPFSLDSIRPDLLLFRIAAKCLVMWENVVPSSAWIDSQIPPVVLQSLFPVTNSGPNPADKSTKNGTANISNNIATSTTNNNNINNNNNNNNNKNSNNKNNNTNNTNTNNTTTTKRAPGTGRATGGKQLDPRSALSVYLNVLTGCCWGIGLVFAGKG
jgi:hypothetical protein